MIGCGKLGDDDEVLAIGAWKFGITVKLVKPTVELHSKSTTVLTTKSCLFTFSVSKWKSRTADCSRRFADKEGRIDEWRLGARIFRLLPVSQILKAVARRPA